MSYDLSQKRVKFESTLGEGQLHRNGRQIKRYGFYTFLRLLHLGDGALRVAAGNRHETEPVLGPISTLWQHNSGKMATRFRAEE